MSIVSWPSTVYISVQHQSIVQPCSSQHLLKEFSEVPHTTFSILTLYRNLDVKDEDSLNLVLIGTSTV